MKSLLKHIASFALSFVLLMSISGITVYSHYCNDSGFEKRSVIQDLASCEHDETLTHIHNFEHYCTEKTSCETEQEDNDCCDTSEKQIKLVVDFDILKQHKKIKPVFDFIFAELNFSPLESSFVEYIQTIKNSEIEVTAGKKLLVLLHQLKTEPNPHC